MNRRRWIVVLALCAGGLALAGAYLLPIGREPAGQRSGHYNVLLITIDTLRKDAVDPFGSTGRTPNLRWLAEHGLSFSRAFSLSNHTPPSMVALLTGKPPSHFLIGEHAFRIDGQPSSLLPHLKKAGYVSAAALANFALVDESFGAVRGFDSYFGIHHKAGITVRDGETQPSQQPTQYPDTTGPIAREALSFLDNVGNRPFFFWAHFMDPHDPFAPPPDDITNASQTRLGTVIDFDSPIPGSEVELYEGIRSNRIELLPEEKAYIKQMYFDEVPSVDEAIGRLRRKLEELGLLRNTIIIVTSDHGEEFWEHGDFSHGQHFQDVLVNIPLLIYHPEIGGGRVIDQPVSHVDLLPTLFEWLGLDPDEGWVGRSLAPLARGDAFPDAPVFNEEGAFNEGEVAMVYKGSKILFNYLSGVFSVVTDDTYGSYPEPKPAEFENMKRILREYVRRNLTVQRSLTGDAEYEKNRRELLRSLGYLQ